MSARFFGQYLVERGAITSEQLLAALGEQNNHTLGNLAVAKGVISSEDALQVLQDPGCSASGFGDLAVARKLINAEQLAFLRFLLKSDVRALCAVLVQKGFLSKDELTFLTDEFDNEQAKFSIRPQRLPATLSGRSDVIALMSMLENHLGQYGIMPAQFSDPQPYSGRIGLRDLTVRIKIGGDAAGMFVLSFDRDLAVLIAGQVFGTENLHAEGLLGDAVCEFATMVVGAAAAQLATSGHHLTFSAPESLAAGAPFGFARDAGRWEVQTPWGGAYVVAE